MDKRTLSLVLLHTLSPGATDRELGLQRTPVTDESNAMHFTAASALRPRKCSLMRRYFSAAFFSRANQPVERVRYWKVCRHAQLTLLTCDCVPVRGNESIYQLFSRYQLFPHQLFAPCRYLISWRAREHANLTSTPRPHFTWRNEFVARLIWKRLTFAFPTFSVSASERDCR